MAGKVVQKYPECDKIAIDQFLEWLATEGIELCERNDIFDNLFPCRFDRRTLLAKFFLIDLEKDKQ